MDYRPGALQEACHHFGRQAPGNQSLSGLLQTANLNLSTFTQKAGLLHRFSFDTYKRPEKRYQGSTLVIDLVDDEATLAFDFDRPVSWVVLQRSLALVVVLDELLLDEWAGSATFLADTTDAAHVARACFCSEVPESCLLPDSDFVSSEGYQSTRQLIVQNLCSWEDRSPTVFWRGATTGQRRHTPPPGPVAQDDDFSWLPRLDLCRRARMSAQASRYDVGITSIARVTEPHLLALIQSSGFCVSRVTREAFLNRKAIIVIDGNANAWSALFCALLTGACVLKVSSPGGFKQWYYDDLVPWRHYVPVSENLHDLDERVAWVFDHDADAKDIGATGRAFAEAMTFRSVVANAATRLRAWLPTATLTN